MPNLRWLIIEMGRRLWVRASLYALAGIATAMVGIALAPLIPEDWSGRIGAASIGNVLQILASSMLAVATFSLATMVSAYAAASSATTPRVAELLIQDSSAQNALATFIGSFLFSLVGIIALNAGVYGESGRVVLFVATLVVIALIVFTLLRWIDLLSRFGRMGDAIDRAEAAATHAMRARFRHPAIGGRMRVGPAPGTASVAALKIGYVQHIDVAALERIACLGGGQIHVEVLPGAFVDPTHPLASMDFAVDENMQHAVRRAFNIGPRRSFDQDPRFGLVVLSEIASKALSPGINDPGSAIATMASLTRVLAILTEPRDEDSEILYPHVFVPQLAIDDLFEDAFSPISACGAGTLAVGLKLQKTLLTLSRLGHPAFSDAARHQSRLALARARHALALQEDMAQLENAAAPLT